LNKKINNNGNRTKGIKYKIDKDSEAVTVVNISETEYLECSRLTKVVKDILLMQIVPKQQGQNTFKNQIPPF
jgi:hypothetical protein